MKSSATLLNVAVPLIRIIPGPSGKVSLCLPAQCGWVQLVIAVHVQRRISSTFVLNGLFLLLAESDELLLNLRGLVVEDRTNHFIDLGDCHARFDMGKNACLVVPI